MKRVEMELMDWKNVERGAIQQLSDSLVQRTIAEILLKEAEKNIKLLKGLTAAEEDEGLKQATEQEKKEREQLKRRK